MHLLEPVHPAWADPHPLVDGAVVLPPAVRIFLNEEHCHLDGSAPILRIEHLGTPDRGATRQLPTVIPRARTDRLFRFHVRLALANPELGVAHLSLTCEYNNRDDAS